MLNFGTMVRSVRIHPQVFSGLDNQQIIDRLQGEVCYLRRQLRRNEEDCISDAPTICREDELSDQQCLSEEDEELREKLSLQKKTIDEALLDLEVLCDA